MYSRLQPITYELDKADMTPIMKKTYQYNADGTLGYLHDVLDNKFDRLNTFDFAGRPVSAKSGAEANGGTEPNPGLYLPYRQSYQFNEFNNLTQRNNLHWGVAGNNNLNYTYLNNRITNSGFTYDADGRNLTTGYPDDPETSTYNAAGQMVHSVSQSTDALRYYDGNGREVKRQTSNYVDSTTGWVPKPTKYYIRSTVLGGATVSEAWANGKKGKTFVRAAGTQIARQYAYASDTATLQEAVFFEYTDASGMSQKTTDRLGSAVASGDNGEGSPVELDPMGSSVGTSTPYVNPVQYYPDPAYQNLLLPFFDDAPQYVNGQRLTCTLDGFAIGCSSAFGLLDRGAAIPAELAGWQNVPGFSFDSHGLGLFSVTFPDFFTNSSGAIWSQAPGSHGDGWKISEGGTSIWAISWNTQQQRADFNVRRVSGDEAVTLKQTVSKDANNSDSCRKYIKDILDTAVKNNFGSSAISTDVEALFDAVLNYRYANDVERGGIFLREELGGGASDGEILIGIGNPVPKSGGLSRHFVANAITSYITTALQHPEIGLTTIHELMHAAISGFAGSDESFAYAAAEIADVKRPIFTPYDPSKPISATNRGVPYQASEYWGERLDQACGFSSHITHKFTNYKLYK